MKNFFALILTLGCFLNADYAACQNSDTPNTTTFILVRHAEKADSSANTDLSEAGKKRAQDLSGLLSKIRVDAIYTTRLKRTQQTAQVVAENNNLTTENYDMDANFPTMTDVLAKKYAGKTVLIVGHSNTLPVNIARLTKNKNEIYIAENEFDNVYIIQVHSDGTPTNLLQLKYGN
jgi:2,3-bisphosphoglycerate-dependent phosphoglycerate mutase